MSFFRKIAQVPAQVSEATNAKAFRGALSEDSRQSTVQRLMYVMFGLSTILSIASISRPWVRVEIDVVDDNENALTYLKAGLLHYDAESDLNGDYAGWLTDGGTFKATSAGEQMAVLSMILFCTILVFNILLSFYAIMDVKHNKIWVERFCQVFGTLLLLIFMSYYTAVVESMKHREYMSGFTIMWTVIVLKMISCFLSVVNKGEQSLGWINNDGDPNDLNDGSVAGRRGW